MARVKIEDDKSPPQERSGGLYFHAPKAHINFIHSGCTELDLALGGGWVRARISNIIGDNSSGKTLLAIEAAANFALSVPKGKIRYREAESAWDDDYAGAIGFPIDRVDRGEPIETIEDVFEDLEKVIAGAKTPELYIIDSLDALSDRAELGRNLDEGSYGTGKAKMLSQLFRRQVRGLAEKDIHLMIISQIRDKIGVMVGKKTMRTGGRALDFYSSQTLWLTKAEKLKKTKKGVERVVGIQIKGTVEKNKIAAAYRSAEFPIIFGYGIDDGRACMDFLKSIKVAIDEKNPPPLAELQRLTIEHWWEIERSFMPTEKKYK